MIMRRHSCTSAAYESKANNSVLIMNTDLSALDADLQSAGRGTEEAETG